LAQIIPFTGGQNGGTLISAEEKCHGTELCPVGQNSGVLELKKGDTQNRIVALQRRILRVWNRTANCHERKKVFRRTIVATQKSFVTISSQICTPVL
jgi:hypothetical protein